MRSLRRFRNSKMRWYYLSNNICPKYNKADIPYPKFDKSKEISSIFACTEIEHNQGDCCCDEVPIYRYQFLTKQECCLCEVTKNLIFPCPVCGTGNTLYVKRKSTGDIYCTCEECYSLWKEEKNGNIQYCDFSLEDIFDDFYLLGFIIKS